MSNFDDFSGLDFQTIRMFSHSKREETGQSHQSAEVNAQNATDVHGRSIIAKFNTAVQSYGTTGSYARRYL